MLKVDTTNANQMATGQKENYILTINLPLSTDLSVYIKLPHNETSLFHVSSVEISRAGANLILQEPLPQPDLKAAISNTGDHMVAWSLGTIGRLKGIAAVPSDDELVLLATIQALDHPNMLKNSNHWLNFAAVYTNNSKALQYVVQKSVTVRSGGKKIVKLDLRLNSTFQSPQASIYAAG